MNRIVLAFRAFFALLFSGELPSDMLVELGLVRRNAAPAPSARPAASAPVAPPKPEIRAEDGALQLLGLLQREARILDFFMEDISPYTDEQVGGAARDVHTNTRDVLVRHFAPVPVVDAVEGSQVPAPAGGAAMIKFVGNVPATGLPAGGTLRHRGWRASVTNLPKFNSPDNLSILAPAELEVE